MQRLWQDHEDREHDRSLKPGEEKRYKDCRTTCQARTWHDWNASLARSEAVCPSCVKRDRIHPETELLEWLADMVDGGQVFGADEMPADFSEGVAKVRLLRRSPGL